MPIVNPYAKKTPSSSLSSHEKKRHGGGIGSPAAGAHSARAKPTIGTSSSTKVQRQVVPRTTTGLPTTPKSSSIGITSITPPPSTVIAASKVTPGCKSNCSSRIVISKPSSLSAATQYGKVPSMPVVKSKMSTAMTQGKNMSNGSKSTSTTSATRPTMISFKAKLKLEIAELKRKKKLEMERKLMEKRLRERQAEEKLREEERLKVFHELQEKRRLREEEQKQKVLEMKQKKEDEERRIQAQKKLRLEEEAKKKLKQRQDAAASAAAMMMQLSYAPNVTSFEMYPYKQLPSNARFPFAPPQPPMYYHPYHPSVLSHTGQPLMTNISDTTYKQSTPMIAIPATSPPEQVATAKTTSLDASTAQSSATAPDLISQLDSAGSAAIISTDGCTTNSHLKDMPSIHSLTTTTANSPTPMVSAIQNTTASIDATTDTTTSTISSTPMISAITPITPTDVVATASTTSADAAIDPATPSPVETSTETEWQPHRTVAATPWDLLSTTRMSSTIPSPDRVLPIIMNESMQRDIPSHTQSCSAMTSCHMGSSHETLAVAPPHTAPVAAPYQQAQVASPNATISWYPNQASTSFASTRTAPYMAPYGMPPFTVPYPMHPMMPFPYRNHMSNLHQTPPIIAGAAAGGVNPRRLPWITKTAARRIPPPKILSRNVLEASSSSPWAATHEVLTHVFVIYKETVDGSSFGVSVEVATQSALVDPDHAETIAGSKNDPNKINLVKDVKAGAVIQEPMASSESPRALPVTSSLTPPSAPGTADSDANRNDKCKVQEVISDGSGDSRDRITSTTTPMITTMKDSQPVVTNSSEDIAMAEVVEIHSTTPENDLTVLDASTVASTGNESHQPIKKESGIEQEKSFISIIRTAAHEPQAMTTKSSEDAVMTEILEKRSTTPENDLTVVETLIMSSSRTECHPLLKNDGERTQGKPCTQMMRAPTNGALSVLVNSSEDIEMTEVVEKQSTTADNDLLVVDTLRVSSAGNESKQHIKYDGGKEQEEEASTQMMRTTIEAPVPAKLGEEILMTEVVKRHSAPDNGPVVLDTLTLSSQGKESPQPLKNDNRRDQGKPSTSLTPSAPTTSIVAVAHLSASSPGEMDKSIVTSTNPVVQHTLPKRRKRRKRVFFHVMSVMDASKQSAKYPNAEPDKILQPGDLILEINGTNIGGLSFHKACELFACCKTRVSRNSDNSGNGTMEQVIQCTLVVARRKAKPVIPLPVVTKPVISQNILSVTKPSPVIKGDFSAEELTGLVEMVTKVLGSSNRALGHEASPQISQQCMPSSLLARDSRSIQRKLDEIQGALESFASTASAKHWKQEWESSNADVKIPDGLKLEYLTLAQLSAIRVLPRPARGCRCGSTDHNYVNSSKCILYHNLWKLTGKSPEQIAPINRAQLETSLKDLSAIENAFKDRLNRTKEEQKLDMAETKFVNEMEKLQIRELKRAIFAPNFTVMVLCAIAEIGHVFDDSVGPFPEESVTEKKLLVEACHPRDTEEEDDDDIPLLSLGKRSSSGTPASPSKKSKLESTNYTSLGFHPAFIARILVYLSQTWGHVFREPSHGDFAWRWEVHHGQTSETNSNRPDTKNPRTPGSLSLVNIEFAIEDVLIDRCRMIPFAKVPSFHNDTDSDGKKKQWVKDMLHLAHLASPKRTGLLDELMALEQVGIIRKSKQQGGAVLSNDWYTRIDPLVLDDMDLKWSYEADPDNKYLISGRVKRELANYWMRVDGAWALNEDISEVVFLDDEWDEWRRSFEEEAEKRADKEDGIGKFGI